MIYNTNLFKEDRPLGDVNNFEILVQSPHCPLRDDRAISDRILAFLRRPSRDAVERMLSRIESLPSSLVKVHFVSVGTPNPIA